MSATASQTLRRLSSLCLILLLLQACTTTPRPSEPPAHSYGYYSGGSRQQGDFLCKVQEFSHPDHDKSILMIGMIHTADAGFFRQVDDILDSCDIVLEEGVHGLSSFGPHKYFTSYSFSLVNRTTRIQGLMPQFLGLKERDNVVNADVSLEQFAGMGSL